MAAICVAGSQRIECGLPSRDSEIGHPLSPRSVEPARDVTSLRVRVQDNAILDVGISREGTEGHLLPTLPLPGNQMPRHTLHAKMLLHALKVGFSSYYSDVQEESRITSKARLFDRSDMLLHRTLPRSIGIDVVVVMDWSHS